MEVRRQVGRGAPAPPVPPATPRPTPVTPRPGEWRDSKLLAENQAASSRGGGSMALGVRPRTGFESVSMSRRAFLHAAGVGAAVAAAACTHGARPLLPALAMPPEAGPDWSRLRSRLSGSLVLPGDAGYDAARRSFNRLFDGRRPAGVVRCVRPEDVQLAVEVATTSKLPIAARSGGHSYAGYSTPDQGLVVDLAKMAGVDVRPDGTAVVGAGTRLIDLYTALASAGRCLPAGTCPTVGIAGLTLGGGRSEEHTSELQSHVK